jgi:hypothetical protein
MAAAQLITNTNIRITSDGHEGGWTLGVRGRKDAQGNELIVVELFWGTNYYPNASAFTINKAELIELLGRVKT